MRLRTWLVIATTLYSVFGIGLLAAPEAFMAVYGVELADTGVFMSRILGAALLGFALMFWWTRNAEASDVMSAVLRASFLYNAIDLPIVLHATLAGTMNSLGWGPVALHLLLAAGFGYFGFLARERRATG